MVKNSHCSYCGFKFEVEKWPRTCTHCKNISYINPLPVVALIVPVDMTGVLTVRRGENPGKGKLALPGGYMDVGETWQQAAARELKEETGVIVDPNKIKLKSVATSLINNNILVFGATQDISKSQMHKDFDNFKSSREVIELRVLEEFQELAFPTHTDVLKNHFFHLHQLLSLVM